MAKNIAIAYQMKKKGKDCMASGGTVESGSPTMSYADGGEVSDKECPTCGQKADSLPNEFDAVELSEEGKANDVVSRAMHKKFAKQDD